MFSSTISSFWNHFNHFATSENTNLVLIRLCLGDGLAIVRIPLSWAVGETLALAVLHHVHALSANCYFLIIIFFSWYIFSSALALAILHHVHALWTFWGSFNVFWAYLIFFIGPHTFSIPPPAFGILWTCWTLWSLGISSHAFEQNTRILNFDVMFAVLYISLNLDKGAWPRKILKPEFHFLNSEVVPNTAQIQTTTMKKHHLRFFAIYNFTCWE